MDIEKSKIEVDDIIKTTLKEMLKESISNYFDNSIKFYGSDPFKSYNMNREETIENISNKVIKDITEDNEKYKDFISKIGAPEEIISYFDGGMQKLITASFFPFVIKERFFGYEYKDSKENIEEIKNNTIEFIIKKSKDRVFEKDIELVLSKADMNLSSAINYEYAAIKIDSICSDVFKKKSFGLGWANESAQSPPCFTSKK